MTVHAYTCNACPPCGAAHGHVNKADGVQPVWANFLIDKRLKRRLAMLNSDVDLAPPCLARSTTWTCPSFPSRPPAAAMYDAFVRCALLGLIACLWNTEVQSAPVSDDPVPAMDQIWALVSSGFSPGVGFFMAVAMMRGAPSRSVPVATSIVMVSFSRIRHFICLDAVAVRTLWAHSSASHEAGEGHGRSAATPTSSTARCSFSASSHWTSSASCTPPRSSPFNNAATQSSREIDPLRAQFKGCYHCGSLDHSRTARGGGKACPEFEALLKQPNGLPQGYKGAPERIREGKTQAKSVASVQGDGDGESGSSYTES